MGDTLNLTDNLYDKRPLSWLIRELQKQLDAGNDYVSLTTKTEWGDTSQLLIFES